MILRCSHCAWEREVRTCSYLLAQWLLQVHHWQKHHGQKPEVVPDGDV